MKCKRCDKHFCEASNSEHCDACKHVIALEARVEELEALLSDAKDFIEGETDVKSLNDEGDLWCGNCCKCDCVCVDITRRLTAALKETP